MMKKWLALLMAAALLVSVFSLSGCSSSGKAPEENSQTEGKTEKAEDALTLYFTNAEGTKLIAAPRVMNWLNAAEDIDKLEILLAAMKDPPAYMNDQERLYSIVPGDLVDHIELGPDDLYASGMEHGKNADQDKVGSKILKVYLTDSYETMDLNRWVLFRTGLTQTVFELGMVDYVEFLTEDTQTQSHLVVDTVSDTAEMILNQYGGSIYSDEVRVMLYFMNESGTKLVKEERMITLNMTENMTRAVLEALIDGPREEGHLPTIPEGTKIKDILMQNGTYYVDLSPEFQLNHEGSEQLEMLTIYSIVNSLSQLGGTGYVQFFIDGQQVDYYKSYVRLDQYFTKDLSLVEE